MEGNEYILIEGRITKSFKSHFLKVLNLNLKKKICWWFHCKLIWDDNERRNLREHYPWLCKSDLIDWKTSQYPGTCCSTILLAALHSSPQMIPYEGFIRFIIVIVCISAGFLNVNSIILAQKIDWLYFFAYVYNFLCFNACGNKLLSFWFTWIWS